MSNNPITGEPAGRMLEPESRGIWRTIVVAHVRLGIVGVVAGLSEFLGTHGGEITSTL